MGGTAGKATSNSAASSTTMDGLPIMEIPGSYGLPLLGPLRDKLAFYWTEGVPDFFDNRLKKYKSSVFRMNMIFFLLQGVREGCRMNMIPGPPYWKSCPVIMCVDQKSYRTLFDTEAVDKTDILIGTFLASWKYSGGYRTTPYLDSSEERHTKLKALFIEVCKRSKPRIFPEFHRLMSEVFVKWESGLKQKGEVDFSDDLTLAALRFNFKAFYNADPADPTVEANLGKEASKVVKPWLIPLVLPLLVFKDDIPTLLKPILAPVVELLTHTFPVPYGLIKPQHEKIVAYFRANAKEVLDVAETKFGLDREDALHNLLFSSCFNSWGGIQFLFPDIVKRVSSTSPEYQKELSAEVRKAVRENGGITPEALSSMPLVQSVVYEILRLDPPVPYQFGIARKDLILESHDAAFRVKKGEMLAGYMRTDGG
ncbi:hypothetical protein R1sor_007701 [Riccia sorocarpa]|uniref:Cytochrome P450 n=1 Tax=Riccia sorocarpa TaxID=122646 RepID=A0ABD3HR80_9MARC